jgi:hypothetical protein
VLLYGEQGGTAWTFLRREADGGFVAVGERIAPAVSPALDAVMDRLEEARREESEAMFPGFDSGRRYAWRVATFLALDDDRRTLGPLRGGMIGSQDAPTVTLALHAQWEVPRMRRRGSIS